MSKGQFCYEIIFFVCLFVCLFVLTSCQTVCLRQIDCRVQESQENESTNGSVSCARVFLVNFLLQVVANHAQRPGSD